MGVAIFAIISAMVVSTLQSNADRNAKLEAERFIAVVNEVRDEAVISGKTFIVNVNEKGGSYDFSVAGSQSVSQQVVDSLLRVRNLHKSVSLKWEVYEQEVDEDDFSFDFQDPDDDESSSENSAKAYVTPLGELTPFKIRFGGEENAYIVALNDDGNLSTEIKPANFF